MTRQYATGILGRTAAKGCLMALSGPGIAFISLPVNSSGTSPVCPQFFAVWDQQSFLDQFAEQLRVMPLAVDAAGSGAAPQHWNLVVEAESRRIPSEDEPLRHQSPADIIAEIRSALSLQVKELAEVLRVERPTVYGWIKGLTSPQRQNRDRLRQVSRLAQKWTGLSRRPIGAAIRQIDEHGKTLVDYMKDDIIPETLIVSSFRSIIDSDKRTPTPRKSGIRDLAAKHGIKIRALRDQQDQIDIMTGKRVSME